MKKKSPKNFRKAPADLMSKREQESTMDDVIASRMGPRTLVSVSDVAAAVGISVMTVLSWIDAGAVEAVNLSTSKQRPYYRIYKESVLRFLKRRGTSP